LSLVLNGQQSKPNPTPHTQLQKSLLSYETFNTMTALNQNTISSSEDHLKTKIVC